MHDQVGPKIKLQAECDGEQRVCVSLLCKLAVCGGADPDAATPSML